MLPAPWRWEAPTLRLPKPLDLDARHGCVEGGEKDGGGGVPCLREGIDWAAAQAAYFAGSTLMVARAAVYRLSVSAKASSPAAVLW